MCFDGIDTDEISGFARDRAWYVFIMFLFFNNLKRFEEVLKKRCMYGITCLDLCGENWFWLIGSVREI